MSDRFAVAFYTFGSFHQWASEPFDSLDEAEHFVADPPEVWTPRAQDQLVIFELSEVAASSEDLQ